MRPARRDILRLGGLLIPALAAPAVLTGCGTSPASSAGNILRVAQAGDPKATPRHTARRCGT